MGVRGTAESLRGKLRRAREARPLSVREALRSSLEALPATLRSVREALRSALDVLRGAPEYAARPGEALREYLVELFNEKS